MCIQCIFRAKRREAVILIAAAWHSVKPRQWDLRRLFSQFPELAKVASAYSSSLRLPNVFLENAHGEVGSVWGCYL